MNEQPRVPQTDEVWFYVGFMSMDADAPPNSVWHFSPPVFQQILEGIEAKKAELIAMYPDEKNFKLTVVYTPDRFMIMSQTASSPSLHELPEVKPQ